MTEESKRLEATWETWATTDPLFAILSDPTKRGGKWDIDEFMAHTPELDTALALVTKHHLLAGRSVALDLGCGFGRITQALANHFDSVVGVDISEAMIAQAVRLNRHGDRCQYFRGDLSRFADNTFDLAFSVYVIQHVPKSMQRDFLRELVRVIKPDGVLICQIAAPPRGIAKLRTQFGPRWLSELRFRRRFGSAPMIEMNPLHEREVSELIAPAWVAVREGEWFLIQRDAPQRSV